MPFPSPEALLPHRPPRLVLTRLVEHDPDQDPPRLVAEADFAVDAPGVDRGVVPGLLLVEGLAQALACLGRLRGEAGDAALLGLENAAFPVPEYAPCTLRFEIVVTAHLPRITEARGVVYRVPAACGAVPPGPIRADPVVCTATLRAALL